MVKSLLIALAEDLKSVPTSDSSEPSVSSAPEEPMASAGLLRCKHSRTYTHTLKKKIHPYYGLVVTGSQIVIRHLSKAENCDRIKK